MVFTIGTLLEASLLLINAIAILNEERFLKKSESYAWEVVLVIKYLWI